MNTYERRRCSLPLRWMPSWAGPQCCHRRPWREPGDDASVRVTVDIDEIREPSVLARRSPATPSRSPRTARPSGSPVRRTLPTSTSPTPRRRRGSRRCQLGVLQRDRLRWQLRSGADHRRRPRLESRLLDGGSRPGHRGRGGRDHPGRATLPGNNVGLVDQELLVSAFDSEAVAATRTPYADLYLRTRAEVAAGETAQRSRSHCSNSGVAGPGSRPPPTPRAEGDSPP